MALVDLFVSESLVKKSQSQSLEVALVEYSSNGRPWWTFKSIGIIACFNALLSFFPDGICRNCPKDEYWQLISGFLIRRKFGRILDPT